MAQQKWCGAHSRCAGRDIDDTLALLGMMALHAAKTIRLVGVIGTGGAGIERARVVRGWLRRFGIPDAEIPVAACPSEGMVAGASKVGVRTRKQRPI